MDLEAIVIISVTGIVALAIISFAVMGIIAFKKTDKGGAKSFGLMLQRGNFLRISTVLMVVVAVIFLALLDIVKEKGVVGILSGIAGYVLGGMERNPKEQNEKDDD